MVNLICAFMMAAFGLGLLLLSYFGPYKEYLNEKANIYVIDKGIHSTVTVSRDGESKLWSYDEFYKVALDKKDAK